MDHRSCLHSTASSKCILIALERALTQRKGMPLGHDYFSEVLITPFRQVWFIVPYILKKEISSVNPELYNWEIHA
jgi:hypothetical protein